VGEVEGDEEGDIEGELVGFSVVGVGVGFGVGSTGAGVGVTGAGVGQALVLQLRSSLRAGQALPPFAGCCVMFRVRDCLPPPHDFEQLLQLPNAETVQSFFKQPWPFPQPHP